MGLNGNLSADYASIVGKVRAFTVDNTLSISGACADAEAVGIAISKMDTETAVRTANEAKTTAETAVTIAEGANETANATVAALAKFADAARVVVSSYTGSGAVSHTLGFPFEPKVVIVLPSNSEGDNFTNPPPMLIAINGMNRATTSFGSNGRDWGRVNLTWSGRMLSWTFDQTLGGGNGALCLNAYGTTYCYVAFGTKDD